MGAVLALWLMAGAVGQAADYCLVGTAGAWTSGFEGVMNRHGIPHASVLTHQLFRLDDLTRYDALFLASVNTGWLPSAAPVLERFVRQGGVVYFDTNTFLGSFACESVEGEPPLLQRWATQSPAVKPCRAGLQPVAPQSLLSPEWTQPVPESGFYTYNRLPANLPGAQVLARIGRVSIDSRNASRYRQYPSLKTGDPALIRVPRGKGFYILSAPGLGVGMSLYAIYDDALALALLRVATRGRGVPQLDTPITHLERHVSLRTVGARGVADESDEVEYLTYERPVRVDRPQTSTAETTPGEGFERLDEEAPDEFTIAGRVAPGAAGVVLLNYADARHYYAVTIGENEAALQQVIGGRRRLVSRSSYSPAPDGAAFEIKEQRNKLTVFLPGEARLQIQGEPLWRGNAWARQDRFAELRLQPMEAIFFTDDFMRSGNESGEWESVAGTWRTIANDRADTAANPFALEVTAAETPSLTLAGHWFWNSYWMRAMVRPAADAGAVGLVTYYQDEENYWLFRAAVCADRTAVRDGLQLVRVVDGERTVIEKADGALPRDQWYRLSVRMIDKWVGAFIDGERVLLATDTHLSGGRVGLWAEGAVARFDDVAVTSAFTTEMPPEVFRGQPPGHAGLIDQDTWAGPASDWRADPDRRGVFWNRGTFFGDAGVRFDCTSLTAAGQTASLWLADDAHTVQCELEVVRGEEGYRVSFRTRERSQELSLPFGESAPTLALRRRGKSVIAAVDGRGRWQSAAAAGALRMAFAVEGNRPSLSAVTFWSDHTQNDTFEHAPANWWVGSGKWDLTNRWSCQPEWSWFGGVSPLDGGVYRGVAAIWSKRRFTGDMVVDFYTAPKMIPVPGSRRTLEQLRDFNVTICGDGSDVRSGYAFLVGPAGGDRIALYRQGQMVVQNDDFRMPRAGHNHWFHLTVRRQGATVRLQYAGQTVVEYEDPEPLPDGYVAVWTAANGIIVPRVTIHYSGTAPPLLSRALKPAPVAEETAPAPVE